MTVFHQYLYDFRNLCKCFDTKRITATGFPWLLSYTQKVVMRMIVFCCFGNQKTKKEKEVKNHDFQRNLRQDAGV